MSNIGDLVRVDRRTTIKWLAATMAAAYAGCSSDEKYLGDEIPAAQRTPLLGVAAEADGVAYGGDPDRMNPVVPWARTMTESQLDIASTLADIILPEDDRSPAASALGVPDFIDEWVSAPYAQQQEDREIVLAGLEWLERQSHERFDRSFAAADQKQQVELVDSIAKGTASRFARQSEFFRRFRWLAVGAYYTTEAGIADIGYIGNTPIAGEYPGPDDEAMAHLAGILGQLRLEMPAPFTT